MPFWKQSDDPWDRKPGKSPQPREPKADPLDSLKTWNEERKAKAKEKEEAKRLPPEPCPWCGKDMEQGYMMGDRGGITWYAGVLTTKAAWIGDSSKEHFNLASEGVFTMYKTVWLCRECGKMVFDMPDLPDPSDFYDPFAPRPETEETKEEEASEE